MKEGFKLIKNVFFLNNYNIYQFILSAVTVIYRIPHFLFTPTQNKKYTHKMDKYK
jgi:hypothetical protein